MLDLRALPLCFFPGGPSGLPEGVLASPGFFCFPMTRAYGIPDNATFLAVETGAATGLDDPARRAHACGGPPEGAENPGRAAARV